MPDTVGTGANITHPINNQQLHIRGTARCSVGHQRYVLVASSQAGVHGAIALSEANTVDTCPVSPISHLNGDRPCGQAAVFSAVGLPAEQLTHGLSEISHLQDEEKKKSEKKKPE